MVFGARRKNITETYKANPEPAQVFYENHFLFLHLLATLKSQNTNTLNLNNILEKEMATKPTHVLAVGASEGGQDYHVAGTLTDLRKVYSALLTSTNLDQTKIRKLDQSLCLYRMLNQPEWTPAKDSVSLVEMLTALKRDGLNGLALNKDAAVESLKTVGKTLKSEAPALAMSFLGAVKGGLIGKAQMAATLASTFAKVQPQLGELKATGEAAVKSLRDRISGNNADGIVMQDGAHMVHATWLANPDNAKPLTSLASLKKGPATPKPA